MIPHSTIITAQVHKTMRKMYSSWGLLACITHAYTGAVRGAANYKVNIPLPSTMVFSCYSFKDAEETTYDKDAFRVFCNNNHVDFDIIGGLSAAEAKVVCILRVLPTSIVVVSLGILKLAVQYIVGSVWEFSDLHSAVCKLSDFNN